MDDIGSNKNGDDDGSDPDKRIDDLGGFMSYHEHSYPDIFDSKAVVDCKLDEEKEGCNGFEGFAESLLEGQFL